MSILREHKTLFANLTLIVLLLVGAAYLLVDVARVKPFSGTYTVTVQLDQSGGLQPGNDVTWRGFRVGAIKSIQITGDGSAIQAVTQIDDQYRIPADTLVHVGNLSAAGEQYLDFRPNTDRPPYLRDGQVIPFNPDKITTPTQIWDTLANTNDLIAQIDPNKFQSILSNLDTALSGGPDQLRGLINGLSIAAAGLDHLLPQTVNLIHSLESIAGTTSMAQPDLGTLTRNSQTLIEQADAANSELRQLLDRAPGQLALFDRILNRNMDPIQQLATTMDAIVKAALVRLPAISALFPALVVGTSAMGVPAHDNEFYTIVDIWPRPFCQYSTKPTAQYVVQDGTFGRWHYCENPPPGQQIRGSSNAPRPDVPNNGAQMPAGADPNARTMLPVR
ncbi:MlaD family protein [Nocardia sp. NPDC020380]|uniref:MlaD family protein n=1 Tax=Nocardia sp. NPDC020380 TaxID=3364309 RepID=UPI00379ABAD9